MTDTSKEAVRTIQRRIGSTPFPEGFQDIADDAAMMIAALAALDTDALVRAALERAAGELEPKNPRDDWTDYARQHHADAIAIRALADDPKAMVAIKEKAGWTT